MSAFCCGYKSPVPSGSIADEALEVVEVVYTLGFIAAEFWTDEQGPFV